MPTQGWEIAAFAASADHATKLAGVDEFADLLDDFDLAELGPETFLELLAGPHVDPASELR